MIYVLQDEHSHPIKIGVTDVLRDTVADQLRQLRQATRASDLTVIRGLVSAEAGRPIACSTAPEPRRRIEVHAASAPALPFSRKSGSTIRPSAPGVALCRGVVRNSPSS